MADTDTGTGIKIALGFVAGLLVAMIVAVAFAVFGRDQPGDDLPKMRAIAQGISGYEVLMRYDDPATGHTVYVVRGTQGAASVAVVPKGAK